MSTTMPSPIAATLEQIVEAGRTTAQISSTIVDLLPMLRAFAEPGHAGRRRELSIGITEIESGLLWLGQYRRELQDEAARTQARLAKSTEEE